MPSPVKTRLQRQTAPGVARTDIADNGRRSAVRQLEPRNRLAAAPTPPPPRREADNELKPTAAFLIPVSRVQLRHPRSAAVGDLNPDHAVDSLDGDRDRLAWSARPLCRRLLPKSSLTSNAASGPHGCSEPSTPPTNARATRARSARPASVAVSRTAAPAISAPFPVRLRPRAITGRSGHTGMYARLSGTRQARTRRQRRRVRGRPWKASGYTDRATAADAVRLPASPW